ncbi:hydrolase [Streptomyces mashuensis]|uniref:Hydrolase n=1 Tax=Streptomyces mashuensis TaxID=33904 RepID=A0A919B295_9ACTN|nr:alpha/beta hydrolase [Streptomyces mashuensis]GHF37179.1 hydrolase [Streptomyces mashuensis]
MPHYTSYDAAELHYRVLGDERPGPAAPPLVCLAGGPGRDAAYLGDLGGLAALRPLVIPDSRGTGASPPARDPAAYAFPALADDLESLRDHLGLDRFALLAHDAACATAQAYAAAHGEYLTHLVLVTPGSRLQGELPTDAEDIFEQRATEEWWPDAYVAVHSLPAATDLAEIRSLLLRAAPMAYARWNTPQRTHAATEPHQLNPLPRAGFWPPTDEPSRLTILRRLRETRCPVLVITGDHDAITGTRAGKAVAASFPRATLRALHGVGHYPWVDEPEMFRGLVEDFLHTPGPTHPAA